MTHPTRRPTLALAVLAVAAVLLSPAAAAAADGSAPLGMMFHSYWRGFLDFWGGSLKKQSGVVLGALGLAIVCLFIITRAKWRK